MAGQPVQGPWPPHQEPRPDPTDIEGTPVAIPDPASGPAPPPTPDAESRLGARTARREALTCTRPGSATRHRAAIDEAIALLQRGRRRGQGAGRRPEPGAADEAALRLARAARRHQQPARPRLPPGRPRRHASGSARCAGTPTSSAPTLLAGQAADDGRGRAADRRPDRAQPRHAGRLAVPRRPAGRLGRRSSPRSAATSSRRARAAGARSRSPTSSPARSRTSSATTRSRSRR